MKDLRIFPILCFVLIWLCSCTTPVQVFPDEGVWYCNELDIQISFDTHETSFATINGDRVSCTAENDRRSTQVIIICQEFDSEHYDLGELIIALEHIELTDNHWIMQDDSGHQYVFERIEKTKLNTSSSLINKCRVLVSIWK